jgi:hypothetical protein
VTHASSQQRPPLARPVRALHRRQGSLAKSVATRANEATSVKQRQMFTGTEEETFAAGPMAGTPSRYRPWLALPAAHAGGEAGAPNMSGTPLLTRCCTLLLYKAPRLGLGFSIYSSDLWANDRTLLT